MTRPMPGLPSRSAHDRHASPGRIYRDCPWCQYWTDDGKRLTDAECAAEYWRAEADHESLTDLDNSQAEFDERRTTADTWHRFATHPHAHQEVQP